ncbi:sigma factor-like helix-turn-helix DNA-binding protein, partial [Phycicoccus jejuensis]|uniref:sigma factor-like helix-turn-helix DNA-binding protein n=1 Tax=Phycicoccus jejuensis TaxID=367299 RepID=UPI0024800E3A
MADILERADWLSPCPDTVDPADTVVERDSTDLYVVAVLSQLPERQRAVLVARDMLGFSALETARLLQSTPAAVNSLLQRARSRLRALGVERLSELVQTSTSADFDLARNYVRAHDTKDVDSIMALLAEDVRISMPPETPARG